jgi:DNA-binding Lrp family transcriptional regulator
MMKETRDRIIELLRVSTAQTVEGLSVALGLTRTAVANQLVALQADGLVCRQGLRLGQGDLASSMNSHPRVIGCSQKHTMRSRPRYWKRSSSRFDVTTGQVIEPPARRSVATYPVQVLGGAVFVEMPGS